MHRPEKGVREMTDVTARLSAEPLRFIWQRHARKRIAERFRVSVETAKSWLREGVPHARREELARVIHAELDAIEEQIGRYRRAAENAGAPRREGADGDRPQADELGR